MPTLPLLPLLLSTYTLHLSYTTISRLRQYESASEKAAEWSNTAAQRLHKTRTTQASGVVAVVISLLSSLSILTNTPSSSTNTRAVIAFGNAAIVLVARQHMAAFWNESEQTRIPFVEKFNEAIRGSEQVVRVLGGLGLVWGAVGLVTLVMGR